MRHLNPEQYYVKQTEYSPNSDLPILVYRNVLPQPCSEETSKEFLEKNRWEHRGSWGTIKRHHFHPNTHECYGIFRGSSNLLLGQGAKDEAGGVTFHVSVGDVVIIPAGVSHCSIEGTEDYRYVGVYPEDAPKWRSEGSTEPLDHAAFATEIKSVRIPSHDPVQGENGYLTTVWGKIRNG